MRPTDSTAILALAVMAACSHLEPLSNAYSAFGRELPPAKASAAPPNAGPVQVRISDLVAEPVRYHMMRVRTEGYVTLRFEGNLVCAAPGSPVVNGCLWLDVEGLADPGFRTGFALVEGTFNGENLGHLGAASGAVEQITLLRRHQ
jgi:hypothetical protein